MATSAGESTSGHDADATASTVPGAESADATVPNVVPVTITLERQQLIGMTTAVATVQTVTRSLTAPATVEAPENSLAEVHVRTPGFLEHVQVRESGTHVTRGQILADYYSAPIDQAEQELLTAHAWSSSAARMPSALLVPDASTNGPSATLESAARRNLERLGMSDADIDAVVRSGTPLRDVPIRAPASGYVTRFAAVLGSYVAPETTLYEIADLAHVWIVASIYERDLPSVRRGLVGQFTSPDLTAPIVAHVALIEPELVVATRTARVRLQVDNPSLVLRPGAFGEVRFDLAPVRAVLVPRDAVVDTGRAQYVFVDAGNGRFDPRVVTVGAALDDHVELLSGLTAGESVVVHGNFLVDAESRLQSALAQSPAPAPSTLPSTHAPANAESGPDCERDFDREHYPDAYRQCRACEQVHHGMGSMEADCKNAIARPWR